MTDMAHFVFSFPMHPKDLTRTGESPDQYVVEQVIGPRDISTALEGAAKFVNNMSSVLSDTPFHPNKDSRMMDLNALKMVTYLLCQFADIFEDTSIKESSSALTVAEKGKKKSLRQEASERFLQEKLKTAQLLNNILHLPIHKLWEPPVVEEEFFSLIVNTCCKFLENSAIDKQKDLPSLTLNIIALATKKQGHTWSCALKIIQVLQMSENSALPLAQLVETIVNKYGQKNIIMEIVREIDNLDSIDGAHETAGAKTISEFLQKVADLLPQVILPSISLLLLFLDKESPVLRNCVLSIIGKIIVHMYGKDNLDEKSQELRDRLLDKLEEHIHDINAFVRTKDLQIWCTLCSAKTIPLSRQHHLLKLIIGRLKDKSTLARKWAMQFLTTYIQNNPFTAMISIEKMKVLCNREEEKLKSMIPDENACGNVNPEGDIVALKAKWEDMESDILKAAHEVINMEDKEIDVEVPELLATVLKHIQNTLESKEYAEAVKMVFAARECFPDNELLNPKPDEEDPLGDHAVEFTAENMTSTLRSIYLSAVTNQFLENHDLILDPTTFFTEAGLTCEDRDLFSSGEGLKDIGKQKAIVRFLQDMLKFAEQIQASIPVMCELLMSSVLTDVTEAIEFFVTLHKFGVPDAVVGIRQMLHLVWVEETSIRQDVLRAYTDLYLAVEGSSEKDKAQGIIKNLMGILQGMTVGDIISFEEIVLNWVSNRDLDSAVVRLLWKYFAKKVNDVTDEESHYALILLLMIAGADNQIVHQNIDILIAIGFGDRAENNFNFAKDVCSMLSKLATPNKVVSTCADPPFRLPQSHLLFTRLTRIIINGVTNTEDEYWVPLAEEGIKLIYELAEHPDNLCSHLLKELVTTVFKASPKDEDDGNVCIESACSSLLLARVLAVVGHVAFHALYHLDQNIFMELKRRQFIKDEKEKKKEQKNKNIYSGGASGVPRNKEHENSGDDDLGFCPLPAEDFVAEFVCKIGEAEIVTGDNLLSKFQELIVHIVSNPSKFDHKDLQSAACLALAKYMMVSSKYCEEHMQLLVTLLEKSEYTVVRENTILLLGDLSMRFPNVIEPWTQYLYSRIKDPCLSVRKNTLTILMHLILNDMIKVKGQISDVALCIMDPDSNISKTAKQLFNDLAKKGNSLYNLLPDIIGRLSDPDCGTEEKEFRTIMKFLISFIEKERQIESLVEKLCHRLRAARSERQWRDLAFCLGLFKYNEKAIRKLQENVTCFSDKLHCEFLYESILSILSSTKKQLALKAEIKGFIEEFEQMLRGFRDNEVSVNDLIKTPAPKKNPGRGPGRSTTRKAKSTVKRTHRTGRAYGSDSDEYDKISMTASSVRRSARISSTAPRKPTRVFFDSDSDDDFL